LEGRQCTKGEVIPEMSNKPKGHHIAFSGSGGGDQDEDAHFFCLPITDNRSHLYIGMLKQHNIYSFKFTFQTDTGNAQQIQLSYNPITNSGDSNTTTNNITVHKVEDSSDTSNSGLQFWECFFSARQRGETSETISFTTPGGEEIKVEIGAKVIRPDLGTPVLKNGIKSVGKTGDAHSETSDWGGFDKEEGEDEGEGE